MKYFIAFILVLLLFSCAKEKKQGVDIENHLKDTASVQIMDMWSGDIVKVDKVPPGAHNLIIQKGITYSFIVNDAPEFLYYPYENSILHIYADSVQIDGFNQKLNSHQQWIEFVANTGEDSLFDWQNSLPEKLSKWKDYDKALLELVNGRKGSVENIALHGAELFSYPSSFRILNQLTDTTGLWVHEYVNYVVHTLKRKGIDRQLQEAFYVKSFYPQHNSLKNDSAIFFLKEAGFERISKKLRNVFDSINENSVVSMRKPIPTITGLDMNSQNIIIDVENKWMLIDFWATWCIPCIKQMPLLDSLMGTKQEVVCYSISVDNEYDVDKWKKVASQYPNLKHIRLSESDSIREKLGIKGLPRMILVDPKGQVFDPYFPHLQDPLAMSWLKQLCD